MPVASFVAAGAIVLSLQPVAALAAPPSVATPSAPVSYVEQAPPVLVGEDVTFSGGTEYGGGYLDFGVTDGTADETLSLVTASAPDTTAGVVTVVGDTVYLGHGSGADVIGAVDRARSGANGALRIDFVSPFANPSFEDGATITGWTVIQDRVDLGVTKIAGYVAQDKSTYSGLPGGAQAPRNDDNAPASAVYTVRLNSSVASDGATSLELTSKMTTANSCDVVHGPAVYSDPFEAAQNDKIYFDWRAFLGDDNFHVYGYILNTDTGAQSPVLDATGGNEVNAFVTTETTIPATGSYRFVFVGGTHDLTCGKAAGATLLIDNVRVYGSKVNDAVVGRLADKLRYQNASDDPEPARTIAVTVADGDGTVSAAGSIPIAITPVDDDPVFGPVAPITLTNTEGPQSYATTTGTLDVTDPDSPITTTIVGGTATTKSLGGIVYTQQKTGRYGTLYLETTTGRYAFVPDADAADARVTGDSETFEFQIAAADLSPQNGPAKTARQTLTVSLEIPATGPGATTAASATAGAQSARVTWSAPAWTAGTPITGYAIDQSTDNGANWTTVTPDTGTTDTSRTVAGLAAGTPVRFRVAALNANGAGAWSTATSPVTPFTTPDAPTAASVVPGDSSATLSWSAPVSDGGAPVTGYVIEQSRDKGATWTTLVSDTGTTDTRHVATGLANGTPLALRVAARNAAGVGPAATAGTTTPRTTAAAPVPLVATPGDGEVALSWSAPVSDGGAPVTGYRIDTSADDGDSWTTVVADTQDTATARTVAGLRNGTPMTFRVAALNDAGTGPAASASATPRRSADAVTVRNVTATNRTLTVSFDAPADDGGTPISDYEYSLDGGATWIAAGTTTSPLTIEGLVNGASYRLQLRAVTEAGPGESSGTSAATPVLEPVAGADGDVPLVRAGRAASTLSGVPAAVTTAADGDGWVISGDGFTLRFESRDADGTPLALSGGSLVVPAGGSLRVRGTGFAPGGALDLWLLRAGVLLGQGTASSDGTFDLTLALPDGIRIGDETVQVNGLDPDGHVRSTVAGLMIVAADSPAAVPGLAETGGTLAAAAGIGAIALLLLSAGGWLLAIGRRRRLAARLSD